MKKTALLLVDVQNAFCSKKGSFWKRGQPIFGLNVVLRTMKSLLAFARKRKWLIIFTRLTYKQDYSDAGLLLKRNPKIAELGGYIENSWDSEIAKTLTPKKQEIVVNKKRYDPFYNTALEQVLKDNNVQRLIVAGLLTNVCVESCVRSAFDRDFEVVVIQDGTTTYSKELYESALKNMKKHFAKVVSFKELEFSL